MSPKEVRRIRRVLGLTQRGLATHVGVERETVNRWETGKVTVPRTASILLRLLAKQGGH